MNYKKLKMLQQNYEKDQNTKLSWDMLENMKADQFISNKEDDFDPGLLLDEEDMQNDFVAYDKMIVDNFNGNKKNELGLSDVRKREVVRI